MDRGFLSGLAAGLVLVVGGGVLVSELAPPPAMPVAGQPETPAQLAPAAPDAVAAKVPAAPAAQAQAPAAVAEKQPTEPVTAQATATPDSAAPAPAEPAPVPTAEAKPVPDPAPVTSADETLATDAEPAAKPAAAAPAEPVPAVPVVQAGEPAPPQTPVTAAEPQAPVPAKPLTSPDATAPQAPVAPAADKIQAQQTAPERVPQPTVADAAATLATTTPVVESALPAAGKTVENPKALLPAIVALPASDGAALAPSPAAKPAASTEPGTEPAAKTPDVTAVKQPQVEPTAKTGAAAVAPQTPGADVAPQAVLNPDPLPVKPESPPEQPVATETTPETEGSQKPGILALSDPTMPTGANAPKPGFATDAPGVRIIRPSASKPLPSASALPTPDADDQTSPALVRNAADFTNPDGKPLMSVILIDDGSEDPARIIDLGFPVTMALDPTRPDAADTAALYRAAGLEVLILATALPAGATASDLEVTFQSHFNALPQAVGVLDLPLDGFQDNRVLAQQIIALLGDGGYGLVTIDKGLNPAAQVAEREKLPQAGVFRELDATGENVFTMRRYLDRAAFRGAQEGSVVVLGHTTDDTLQALVEWAAEGRAANMALCPVSAAMSGI